MKDAPTLGIHAGIPMRDYLKIDAASGSRLEDVRVCPELCKYNIDHDSGETKSTKEGSLVHTAVLEPFNLRAEWAPEPDINEIRKEDGSAYASPRATKQYKEAKAEIEESGRKVVTRPQWDMAIAIRDRLKDMPRLKALMMSPDTITEATGLFEDPVTGELCKFRPDLFHRGEKAMKVNLKTVAQRGDSFKREFAKECHYRGYIRREALYELGVHTLFGERPDYSLFIVVERVPPFFVHTYTVDEVWLAGARIQMREALNTYARCKQKGVWPGPRRAVDTLELEDHYAAFREIDDETSAVDTAVLQRGAA